MISDIPMRETFWNIPLWAVVGIYVFGLLSCAIFAWGVYRRVLIWRQGGPEMRWDKVPARISYLLREGLLQARILSQPYPGVMHVAVFWGFLALLAGTILATIDWEITRLLFDVRILQGPFYLLFEVTLDLFGLFLAVGLGMACWRRFVVRPSRLEPTGKFAYAQLVLFFMVVSGFIVEAARLAVTQPPWARWSPVGWALGQGFLAAGISEPALRNVHLAFWLAHSAVVVAFIALIPWTYFSHAVATPLNIFFAKLGPRAALRKIDNLEEQEEFGVSRFDQFSWKRRLDFDACTECGRCQDVCCSQISGNVLSPKRLIGKLKRYMLDGDTRPLHGDIITSAELWACTTCYACVRECPAHIDIVDTTVDLRRYLALTEGAFHSTAGATLQNIQRVGNPWGLDPADRLKWADGLDVPVIEAGKPVDYLYWVGCAASYDARTQKVARAFVKLLRRAGVSFAVMAEERCHGEVGRRLGEEYLYQTATAENIGNLQHYSFKKIVTHCPHCFNTLKNEYPQFEGGRFDVMHHSMLIEELVASGKLELSTEQRQKIAYHDPCYLGRCNNVFDAPRAALAAVPGAQLIDLPRRKSRSLCCGGGGGHMWMEMKVPKSLNIHRTEEVLAAKADVVAVGCPYCLSMLDLGAKVLEAEDKLKVRDIAEIVADAMAPQVERAAKQTVSA